MSMAEAQKIPFLRLFSAWRPPEELAGLVDQYLVTRAVIDKASRSIRAEVACSRPPDDGLRRQIERSLALAYRVEKVELDMAGEPAPAPTPSIPQAPPLERMTAPAVPADSAPAPVPADDPQAAFRRTEEIRRKALAGLKTARPREKKPGGGAPRAKLL